jgi:hypothetical protein
MCPLMEDINNITPAGGGYNFLLIVFGKMDNRIGTATLSDKLKVTLF